MHICLRKPTGHAQTLIIPLHAKGKKKRYHYHELFLEDLTCLFPKDIILIKATLIWEASSMNEVLQRWERKQRNWCLKISNREKMYFVKIPPIKEEIVYLVDTGLLLHATLEKFLNHLKAKRETVHMKATLWTIRVNSKRYREKTTAKIYTWNFVPDSVLKVGLSGLMNTSVLCGYNVLPSSSQLGVSLNLSHRLSGWSFAISTF